MEEMLHLLAHAAKMGTIVSLWRYDASAGQAPPLDNLRRPPILRYAP
jgi:hypothetical protein